MRLFAFVMLLMSSATALAQTPAAPPPITGNPETVYSDAELERDRSLSRQTIEEVLQESAENQYARWKRPVCFNVYGLAATAKYVVERRMREIARQVGAPVDGRDSCPPTVTVAITPDPQATLQSIARARAELLPRFDMITSRLKQSQPIQAWYAISINPATGPAYIAYDAFDGDTRIPRLQFMSGEMSRLNSGISTAIQSVVIVVRTDFIMGKSLGTIADHFAMLALAETRTTPRCKDVPTIANLMFQNCDAAWRPDAITNNDLALLTGLYKTPDEMAQRIQKARVIGNMRKTLEAQQAARVPPQ